MSNVADAPGFDDVITHDDTDPAAALILLEPRITRLTTRSSTVVRRTLPHRAIRMIGAWCFVDHYGPDTQSDAPMWVGPHPHTGLQTVTWLFGGVVEHRDSVGSVQQIQPGNLNLMTAGHGISHAEVTVGDPEALVHGVQLWVALPDTARTTTPRFAHHSALPRMNVDGADITVFMGTYAAVTSPAETFTPLLGAQIDVAAASIITLPLDVTFEHGLLVAEGEVDVDGVAVRRGTLLYVPEGHRTLTLASASGATLILLGGTPFDEEIVMWWNFIGRSHEEIVQMRDQWNQHDDRFGTVIGYERPTGMTSVPSATAIQNGAERPGWIPAPDLPGVRLHPRGRTRG